MKKIFFVSLCFLLTTCTKDITDLNDQTKKPINVPAGSLFANATRVLADKMTTTNLYENVFRFVVKHWAMVTYQDEVQYDFTSRGIITNWWNSLYMDVLADLNDAARVINEDGILSAGEKANKLAIVDVMQVYTYSVLVNTFGNVPYSEAINTEILFPKYDDAQNVIYPDLINRLNADIAQMSEGAAGFSPTEDLIYKGSMDKWIKFANTLQLKLSMMMADVNEGLAKTTVEAVHQGAFSSPADDAAFYYLTGSPNQNPEYVDFVVNGNKGYYVSTRDFIDTLMKWADPRLAKFFSTNSSGVYHGGVSGTVNNPQSNFSLPQIIDPDAPSILLDYVEAEFYRAEAIERGYAVPGTAEEHYNNAITASILYWGGTEADAATYLANPLVNYSSAAGNWKQKIGAQKWISLYNRSYEGWTEMRRLDYPKLPLPVAAKSAFPNRFTYPSEEQTTNGANYTEAAEGMGGDRVETKIFWDTY